MTKFTIFLLSPSPSILEIYAPLFLVDSRWKIKDPYEGGRPLPCIRYRLHNVALAHDLGEEGVGGKKALL